MTPPSPSYRTVPLTGGFVATVDPEDYERVIQFKWRSIVARRKDGSIRTVYAARNVKKQGKQRNIYLHRFILGLNDRRIEVDHRDGDGLRCTRENMRAATKSQNQANQRLKLNNTSGIKGAYRRWQNGMWHATIQVSGTRSSLGYFPSRDAAAVAYDTAAARLFGEFALLNSTK